MRLGVCSLLYGLIIIGITELDGRIHRLTIPFRLLSDNLIVANRAEFELGIKELTSSVSRPPEMTHLFIIHYF